MRAIKFNASLIRSGLAAAVLLVAATATYAQSVDLTAGPRNAALPDGQTVPMWGYTCTTPGTGATCAAANPNAGANWSPVVITVPYTEALGVSTTSLTINLTNSLVSAGTPSPTSLVIVGQLGGGLGGAPIKTASPVHGPQGPTWPASGGANPLVTCSPATRAGAGALGTNCPPAQPDRVQSSPLKCSRPRPASSSGTTSAPAPI